MLAHRSDLAQPKSIRRLAAPLASAAAIAAALGLTASVAEAQSLRFSDTLPGGIVSTGNTLGLAKGPEQNGPGTQHSIGTFIALDPNEVDAEPANADNPWPLGTTWNWERNGSTGMLTLPAGAQVIYAELVWAGSYEYWPEDVSPWIDDPVSLMAGGAEMLVAPDPSTALTLAEQSYTGFWANYYLRSADVTSFVAQQGSGTYAVAGVPATQGDYTDSLSAAGWSLVVAYRHDGQPIRNLSVFVGGSFVDEDSRQDYTVSGFCAPPYGVVEGNVVISALEGDANLTGDDLAIGVSEQGDFVSLVGPNNPADNFFCSQINGADGQIDAEGSFGDANHDAHAGRNVAGARQGWDTTTLPLISDRGHLQNDQTSAVLRTTTTGDSYMPVLVALELDVKSPDFSDSETEASEDLVEIGDQFVVTTTLTNSGEAQASELALALPIDNGLSVVGFSMDGQQGDANGVQVDAAGLVTGIDAGTLQVGETRNVELVLHVVGPPDNGTDFRFAPEWGHTFTMCTGDAPIDETYAGPEETVPFYSEPPSGGEGGGDPGQGGAAPQLVEDVEEAGGCQCAMVGTQAPTRSGLGAMALWALGAAVALRRRRR